MAARIQLELVASTAIINCSFDLKPVTLRCNYQFNEDAMEQNAHREVVLMRTKLSPSRMDASLEVVRVGDVLTVNGEVFNFKTWAKATRCLVPRSNRHGLQAMSAASTGSLSLL